MRTTITFKFPMYSPKEADRTGFQDYIEYDYEIEITRDTILAYFVEDIIGKTTYKYFSEDKQKGYERAIDIFWQEEMFNKEYFETNESFINWAREHFEKEARRSYESDLSSIISADNY